MLNEAVIVINGQKLTDAQSSTFRVALENFSSDLSCHGLGDDEHGKSMTKSYLERISEIRKPLYKK